jgi:serine/threonine-protein kinase
MLHILKHFLSIVKPGQMIGHRFEVVADPGTFGPDNFAAGGCGIVVKAFNHFALCPKREWVALKFARRHSDQTRLLTEAQIQWRVSDHPHVVPVYDVHLLDKRLFLEMPWMAGGSLAACLRKRAMLPEGEVISIGRAILDALTTIHDRGLAHCDVKPTNILFDQNGVPRLTDFGIALDLGEQAQGLTRSGTEGYRAPETLHPKRPYCSRRSDVWAVGVVLYRSATGRLPFCGGEAISQQSLPFPADLSPGFVQAVRAALTVEEKERPSALELRELLGRGHCL